MTTSVVFLPGMMCDERLFAPQIDALSSQYDIHVLPINTHQTMTELARDVLQKAPHTFALAGLSMGGIVAMEVMAQGYDRVKKIAFLDTNPCAELPQVSALRQPQIDKVKNGKLAEVMRDEMKPNYLWNSPNKPEILNLCMEMANNLGSDVFINQSYALKNRRDYRNFLKNIKVPTLILCGSEDKLCPPQRHELMHNLIPHSKMIVVKNAGHLPTLEQPEIVNQALLNWLKNK